MKHTGSMWDRLTAEKYTMLNSRQKNIKHLITMKKAIHIEWFKVVLKLYRRYSLQVIQIYAPTSTSIEKVIPQLYEDIYVVKTQRNINEDQMTRRENFGLGAKNEREETLLNCWQNADLVKSRQDNEIDHIIFNKKYIFKVSVLYRFNTGSDHWILRVTINKCPNRTEETIKAHSPTKIRTTRRVLNKYQEELKKKIRTKEKLTKLEMNALERKKT